MQPTVDALVAHTYEGSSLMTGSKEKDFELEVRIVVAGYGKQHHWAVLGREIKKLLAIRLGDCEVSVTRVRRPGGEWYDAGIGTVAPFDYEAGGEAP